MELAETSQTIQPLDSYQIQLNHTANYENAYYEGTLQVKNTTYSENIKIKYHSYIAELNIINITPNYNIISPGNINITTQFTFGSNNITENTTYTIKINNTNCTAIQNTTQGGYIAHTCATPSVPGCRRFHRRPSGAQNFPAFPASTVKAEPFGILLFPKPILAFFSFPSAKRLNQISPAQSICQGPHLS